MSPRSGAGGGDAPGLAAALSSCRVRAALSSWRVPAALAVLAFAIAVAAATSASAGAPGVPRAGDGVPAADGAVTPDPAGTTWTSPLASPSAGDLLVGDRPEGDLPAGDRPADADVPAWQPGAAATGEPDEPGPDGTVRDEPEPQAADPVALRIPDLDVASDVIPLAVDDAGVIEVPADPAQAGWWVDGPEPGERGAAVILGHVDSWEGPGVFYGLQALGRDDQVLVDRADGTTVVYAVTEAALYAKADFPAARVYDGAAEDRLLRLVTCGGSFDPDAGSYAANYVVYAEQVDVIATPPG